MHYISVFKNLRSWQDLDNKSRSSILEFIANLVNYLKVAKKSDFELDQNRQKV
jgi:hypothetical protein